MIGLQGVSKHYQLRGSLVKAVDNVDLKVKPKDFALIMGRSGSGKTTLLSLMTGLTRPTSGAVSIDGMDIWQLSDRDRAILRNRRIGFILQYPSLIPSLNVLDNVRLSTVFQKKVENIRMSAVESLKNVELEGKGKAYPSQLSAGERKRVVIARALMQQSEILIADEPTSDLDEETEREIMQLISGINDKGTTVVMVTHSSELAGYGSRRFRMLNGILTELQ
jgi:ABC-type lipoprotein export system ATPase subunit